MLGVFAPAPNSLANLPLIGGVPLTLATITAAIWVVSSCLSSTSGPTDWWQLVLLWQDFLSGKLFLPSMLPPGLHSSLDMVSLKAGHLRSSTLGIRLSSQPRYLFSL